MIITTSFTKSSLVHHTFTPAESELKSPKRNVHALPPPTWQPAAMCE